MTLAGWLAALAVGLLAGGVSALTGVGGGAIMVPFLYFFLAHSSLSGVPPPVEATIVAHATSLVAMVPISVRGAWLYRRAGLVDWPSAWRVSAASVVAAVLGARSAIALPGDALKVVFGAFLLAAAIRVLAPGDAAETGSGDRPAAFSVKAVAGGAVVGFISALLGVGGGLVAIPVLIYGLGLPLRQVPATSLVIVAVTALTGVLAYAVYGWSTQPGMAGVLTYIDPFAGAALTAGALVAVPLGARLQQKLPSHALRWVVAGVFVGLGIRILLVSLLELLNGS